MASHYEMSSCFKCFIWGLEGDLVYQISKGKNATHLCDWNAKEFMWIWSRRRYLGTMEKYYDFSPIELRPDGVEGFMAYIF